MKIKFRQMTDMRKNRTARQIKRKKKHTQTRETNQERTDTQTGHLPWQKFLG